MYDDLMEKDPEMRRLREKYKTEGLAEGLAEGLVEGLRESVLICVKARFPSLTKQARQWVAEMMDADDLQELLEQLMTASDEASVRALLASTDLN